MPMSKVILGNAKHCKIITAVHERMNERNKPLQRWRGKKGHTETKITMNAVNSLDKTLMYVKGRNGRKRALGETS